MFSLTEQKMQIEQYVSRADFFEILSIMLRNPDKMLVEGLANGTLFNDLSNCLRELGVEEERLTELAKYFVLPAPCTNFLQPMRVEYNRLYLMPREAEISLYENVFRFVPQEGAAPQMFIDPMTLHVEQLYKKAGVVPHDSSNEPADYLPIECEFMSFLYTSLITALSSEDTAAAELRLQQISEFREQHLDCWLPALMTKTSDLTTLDIYRGMAALTLEFGKIY